MSENFVHPARQANSLFCLQTQQLAPLRNISNKIRGACSSWQPAASGHSADTRAANSHARGSRTPGTAQIRSRRTWAGPPLPPCALGNPASARRWSDREPSLLGGDGCSRPVGPHRVLTREGQRQGVARPLQCEPRALTDWAALPLAPARQARWRTGGTGGHFARWGARACAPAVLAPGGMGPFRASADRPPARLWVCSGRRRAPGRSDGLHCAATRDQWTA